MTTSRPSPFVEGSLDYRASRTSNFRYYARFGLDSNETSFFQDNRSFRTGLSFNQQVAENLTASAGVNYVHSELNGGEFLADSDDDLVSIDLGLRYQIQRNLALYGNYYYINSSSDVEFREYDRHRFHGRHKRYLLKFVNSSEPSQIFLRGLFFCFYATHFAVV